MQKERFQTKEIVAFYDDFLISFRSWKFVTALMTYRNAPLCIISANVVRKIVIHR